ncbi:hypothetical protein [Crocosphaera sp. Alani8]|uniref:hypothetical protein n=1 Tax=Crocosphaera sp. Alani8 TaxID=3038952 RepID=UPI00313C768F
MKLAKVPLIPLNLVKDFISSWRDDSPPDGGGGGGGGGNVPTPNPVSPTDGGDSVTTSEDGSVTSYQDVEGNDSEKGNSETTDYTNVSDDDPNSSYLFSEHTQNLEEEKERGVELLSEDNGGEIPSEKNATSSEKVTTTEPDSCNLDIMQDTEVNHQSLDSEHESENEVTEILEWDNVVAEINSEMTRLGWNCDRGERYLVEQYEVRSRLRLSDEQILEFLGYLKSQRSTETDRCSG